MLLPVLALSLAAGTASRIVVVPVASGADVAPQSAAAFTNALVGELRRQQPRVEIITQRDIEGMLSVERTKQFLGCSTDACMAELGGALGADRLVTGDVARLGESLMVHLRVFDSTKVRVTSEVDRRFKRGSFDDVLDALPAMVAELFRASPAGAPERVAVAQAPLPGPASSKPTALRTPPVASAAAWRTLPPMPTARSGTGLAAVGGKLYAIGGIARGRALSDVQEFDPQVGTWRARAPMPTPRSQPGVAVLNGRIYAVGGWNGADCGEVEEYDPSTDTWVKRAPLPGTRSSAAVVAVAGRVFVLGGNSGGNYNLVDVYAYDPSADAWKRRSSMPVGRARFVAGVVGNEVYAIGGDPPNGARVDAYDAIADKWTTRFRTRAPLPQHGFWMGAATANDRIYVLGGQSATADKPNAPGRDTALSYDPAANSWTELPPLPWPRFLLGAAVLGNDLVAVGGAYEPNADQATAAALSLGP